MGCVVLDEFLYVLGGTNRHNEVLQVILCPFNLTERNSKYTLYKITKNLFHSSLENVTAS